jgi:hypothetical protein
MDKRHYGVYVSHSAQLMTQRSHSAERVIEVCSGRVPTLSPCPVDRCAEACEDVGRRAALAQNRCIFALLLACITSSRAPVQYNSRCYHIVREFTPFSVNNSSSNFSFSG